jgi:acetolactate synthase-1/3 small subunit
VIEQIIHQLERLVPVHRVIDLTSHGESVEREVALVKVVGKGYEHDMAAHARIARTLRAPCACEMSVDCVIATADQDTIIHP